MTADPTADSPGEAPRQVPSTAGMTTKVVKGSMWTLAGQVAPLLVSLVTTPFVIRMLGAEGYGVLVLLALIPTYFAFADFGMSLASTRFASNAHALGDPAKEARVIQTAALVSLSVSIPIASFLFVFSNEIAVRLNVPPALLGEGTLALRIVSVTMVVNFLNAILNSPQLARLRMDLNTLVVSGPRILGMIATPLLIYFGFGIVSAVSVLLVCSVSTLVGMVIIARSYLPNFLGSRIEKREAVELIRFGWPVVLVLCASLTVANLEKLVLAKLSSPGTVAYYSVAFTVASMVTLFSNAISQSLIPAFSQLLAQDKREQLQELIGRSILLNLLIFAPVAILLSVIAREFFTLWAGPDFGAESTPIFYFLLVGLVFNFAIAVFSALFIAANKTKILASINWIEVVPYFALTWLLTTRWGAIGAAAAWSSRVLIESAFLIFFIRKRLGVSFASLTTRVRWLLIALLVLAIGPVVSVISGLTIGAALALAVLGVAGYGSIVWFKVASDDERSFVMQKFRFV